MAWVGVFLQRMRIRENYRIEGGVGGDLVRSVCCGGCVMVQDEREVRGREEERRRWEGPGSGEVGAAGGYRREGGMRYN